MTPRLVVLGGGRMGEALVRGFGASGLDLSSVTVVEPVAERRRWLADELGVTVSEVPVDAHDGAIVAVKPQVAEDALRALARCRTPRWLSIMAGIPLAKLEAWAGEGVAVVRAMPNTPAVVRAGITAIAAGASASASDLGWARTLLESVGEVIEVEESEIDAVTAVSGSGPAYVFLFTEALAEAGVAEGLEPETARKLARATVVGAARLLDVTGEEPEALRAQVTSPKGTTEVALSVLEAGGLRRLITGAAHAAARRSRELGSG
ncbi:MAG: pyrroline-5-carboxylate reductase [Acidimicrobiales bacterium]